MALRESGRWAVLAAGLCVAKVLLAQAGPAPPPAAEDYTFSTNVERVLLPITVVDHKGRLVTGLTEDNFRVYEDGRLQTIRYFSHSDVPVTVGLVVDGSASMGPKRNSAVLAAMEFLRLSNPSDQLFVVNFNEHVSFGLPGLHPFSSDPVQLRSALLDFPCTGKTALYDAISDALGRLATGSRDKKALIVISDGGDNASHQEFKDLLDHARRSDAIIYTIGFYDSADPDWNPRVLSKLAAATGGEAFFPNDAEQLPAILGDIAKVLRSQYTIAYEPSHGASGYRRIRVIATTAGGKRLRARTRAGYFAPAAEHAGGGTGK
jgi:Ca-activated chloride channel family protein